VRHPRLSPSSEPGGAFFVYNIYALHLRSEGDLAGTPERRGLTRIRIGVHDCSVAQKEKPVLSRVGVRVPPRDALATPHREGFVAEITSQLLPEAATCWRSGTNNLYAWGLVSIFLGRKVGSVGAWRSRVTSKYVLMIHILLCVSRLEAIIYICAALLMICVVN